MINANLMMILMEMIPLNILRFSIINFGKLRKKVLDYN